MIFSGLSLNKKILFSVFIACCVCASIAVGVSIHYNKAEFREGLVEKARTIHNQIDHAAEFVATQAGSRRFRNPINKNIHPLLSSLKTTR